MKEKFLKHKKKILIILSCLVCLICLYLFLIYSNNSFIKKWRTIYIETAMTTTSHQWLAEWFIPHNIIDEVMKERTEQEKYQKELLSNWKDILVTTANEINDSGVEKEIDNVEKPVDPSVSFYEKYWELDTISFHEYLKNNPDVISNGYENIVIDDLSWDLKLETVNNDKILAVDIPNNILIIGVSGDGYIGKLAIIKNTSQISIEKSNYFGNKGELASVYSDRYNALLVVNASGFKDVGGHGSGGTIKGSYVVNGKEIGRPKNSYWKFVGLKNDEKLYISNRKDTDISDYKWGIEFYPALIVDGENVVDGSYCMGIQPRTSIGQTKTGDFLMLVIDGRQVNYSLGCTVADCRDILMKYKAYQAMNLDGGSSSVMYYKGNLINKPSSLSGLGRYMPNAFIVKESNSKD